MGHEDLKKKRGSAYNRRDRLIDQGNELLHKWNGKDDWSEAEYRDFNIQVPMLALFSGIGENKVCATMAKVFRSIAQIIIKKKIPFGVEMATLLLNCRVISKRIQKDLSDSIRQFIENEAMFQSYWDEVIDKDRTYDRLRKISGIAKSLDYLGYSVEGSFPGELMDRERRDVDLINDTLPMMAFCQLLSDYHWKKIDDDFLIRLYCRLCPSI